MSVSDLLWEVLEREGHSSIERMARFYSRKLDEDIPAGTLYSWMTRKKPHHRLPKTATSILLVSRISGRSVEDIVKMMADEEARK